MNERNIFHISYLNNCA